MRWIVGAFVCIAFIAFSTIVWFKGDTSMKQDVENPASAPEVSEPNTQRDQVYAYAAISPSDLEDARRIWRDGNTELPLPADLYALLGNRYLQLGRVDEAAACFAEIPTEDQRYGMSARLEQARALMKLDLARLAEENLDVFLKAVAAGRPCTTAQLADALDLKRYLLSVQLRHTELRAVLASMIKLNIASPLDILTYCFPSLLRWHGEQATAWIERYYNRDRDNFELKLALARYRTPHGRLDDALQLIKQCQDMQPEDLRVIAALLEVHFERGDYDAMESIISDLPALDAKQSDLLTTMRGQFWMHKKDFNRAIECFKTVLTSDPSNVGCLSGIATAYARMGDRDKQKEFLQQSQIAARIQSRLGHTQQHVNDIAVYKEIVELTQQAGFERLVPLVIKAGLKVDASDAELLALKAKYDNANP